jgi:small conductance mechanosensitive channel
MAAALFSFDSIRRTGADFLIRGRDYFIGYLPTLLVALVLFAAGMFANKLIMRLLDRGLSKSPIDKSVHVFLGSLVKILLYLILFVTVLAVLGIPMNSLIAVIGSAGLAIGLSMQSSLSNIAAGLILLAGKPFKIGDLIEVNGVTGRVEQISVLSIKLTAPDNTVIYLPNNAVSTSTLKNYTELPTRRAEIIFGIPAHGDCARAVETVRLECERHEKIFKEPAPFVGLRSLTAPTAEVAARFTVASGDFDEVRGDILIRVKEAFDRSGII